MGGEQDAAAPIVHVSTASYSEREARAAVMELAIFSCVNLIAETAARAEVRTFHKNKELHGLEHYAWNVQPNINQNAMQLKRELFARALYFGEALLVEVNGQMLVAQSFQRAEHATAPDEFFGIVLRGDTAIKRRLTSDEVIYITTQNSEARAMLGELGALYGDMLRTSASNYKCAGGMRGTLEIGTQASGDPDFEKDLETLMNERFKAYFEAKNAVLPLTEGYKYTPQTGATIQSASEMSAIEKLTVQQFARACNAYKIPQEIFTGQAGLSKDAAEGLLSNAVAPLTCQLGQEITRKKYGEKAVKGSYAMLDVNCVKHVDIFEIADKADKLIAARLYNSNELRRKVGDPEIPEAWANEYAKTKNYDWGDGGAASTTDEPVKKDGGGGEASNGAENQL